MSVIPLLILAGGLVAAAFLGAFVWAVRTGQFDDTATPPVRMVIDDTRDDRRTPHSAPRTPDSQPL